MRWLAFARLIPPRRSHTTRFHGVLDWASLLRRVFGEDVTRCPRCGDHLRVLAFLTHPDVTVRILDPLGLGSAGPPIAPARAPPDDDGLELDLGS